MGLDQVLLGQTAGKTESVFARYKRKYGLKDIPVENVFEEEIPATC